MATINTIGLGLSGSSGAASFVGRDANANIAVNSSIPGYTSTVTSASTLTLTVASTQIQAFTGSTNNQTVELPDVTTLSLGQSYRIINRTTSNPINVNPFGAALLYILEGNTEATFTCVSLASNVAASWEISNQTIPNAVLLSPSGDQTITSDNLILSGANKGVIATTYQGGSASGSTGLPLINMYTQAASSGALLIYATSMAGAYEGELTNASLTAGRVWLLPDADGTIALNNNLGSGYVRLNPGADQSITSGNLFVTNGAVVALDAVVSGSLTGGFAGNFIAYSDTAALGSLQLLAADSSANYNGILTNASLTSGRTWTLPDASGTIALTSGLPISWSVNSGTSFTAAVANGYILSHVGAVTVTLPTTFAAGTQIAVEGGVSGNSWTISIPGGTNVSAYGASYTTSVASTAYSDNIILLATVANTSWVLLDTSSTSLIFT